MSRPIKPIKKTVLYKAIRRSGKNIRKNIKRYFLRRKLDKATPIFIYQMGKVASSSIYHSLKEQYPGAIGHAHHIGSENWASELFYDWYKNGHNLKIISPIREPIGRNISEYFQLLNYHTGKDYNYPLNELIDDFFAKYPHETPLNWFDLNIKENFGIDVYDTPFPDNGIGTYSLDNVSLLIFKIDLDDSLKERAIRDFIGQPNFKLKNRNISENKEYNPVYMRFIEAISLPDSYLDMMRSSKYFKHFYSKDDIDKIISKWNKQAK